MLKYKMKIRPVGAELFHAGKRTDRHDNDAVNSSFKKIVKTPKNKEVKKKKKNRSAQSVSRSSRVL
jgi:tripartite-type tricarboxylate transporter receptor subunit TctC